MLKSPGGIVSLKIATHHKTLGKSLQNPTPPMARVSTNCFVQSQSTVGLNNAKVSVQRRRSSDDLSESYFKDCAPRPFSKLCDAVQAPPQHPRARYNFQMGLLNCIESNRAKINFDTSKCAIAVDLEPRELL
jgi:hypothetical protein